MRLSPLEEYFYLNDAPQHPMTMAAIFRLGGRLDRPSFVRACKNAVADQPLLRSRIVRTSGGWHRWVETDTFKSPTIEWVARAPGLNDHRLAHIDLKRFPGVRLRIFESGGSNWLQLFMHHCCSDGIGTHEFLDALSNHYGRYRADAPTAGRRPATLQGLLAARARLGMSRRSWLKQIVRHRWDFQSIRSYKNDKPATIQPEVSRRPHGNGLPAPCLTRRFSRSETRSLDQNARSIGLRQNLYLLYHLLKVVAQWRRRCKIGSGSEPLRIAVPVNLRYWSARGMPICNTVGPLFVTVRTDTVGAEMDLPKRIRRIFYHQWKSRAVFSFLYGLSAVSLIPGLLQRLVENQQFLTTAYLSNVGRLFRDRPCSDDGTVAFGDVSIEEATCLAPVWPNSQATILAYHYAGRFHLTLVYDPAAFSLSEAELFFTGYCRQLL
jgi:NRPS condensation-like uncharacterized protein